MNILKLSAVIFFFVILSGFTSQLQAQPEFATVRMMTGKTSLLLVSKGSAEMKTFELGGIIHVNYAKQLPTIGTDNQIINSTFQELYAEGFKLISTSSTTNTVQGNTSLIETIFLLVKE